MSIKEGMKENQYRVYVMGGQLIFTRGHMRNVICVSGPTFFYCKIL